jgi:CheY-like chemotaxis protein
MMRVNCLRQFSQSVAEVTACASADGTLNELQTWKPDVLVSDIGMPRDNGYSLIERVRSLEPENGGLIPAMALTAYARVEDGVRALAAGYQTHASKPIDPADLVAAVASLARGTGKFRGKM